MVFKQFIERLESYFFDEFKLALDFSFKLKTDTKYRNYFATLEKPAPIFVFNLFPFTRDSILKVDNRLINLLLSKQELFNRGRIGLNNNFSLESSSRTEVKDSIESLLKLFQLSWKNIYPVECNLRKLVSNRIKAKVMDLAESCVVVDLAISQNRFHSNLEFCFSTYQLERIIEKRGAKGLLVGSDTAVKDDRIKKHFTKLLIEESNYEISGVLGSLNVSTKQLSESFCNNKVIPIENNLKNRAIVKLNKTPILAADIGQTGGQISLRIKNSYESFEMETKKEKKDFSSIQFPQK